MKSCLSNPHLMTLATRQLSWELKSLVNRVSWGSKLQYNGNVSYFPPAVGRGEDARLGVFSLGSHSSPQLLWAVTITGSGTYQMTSPPPPLDSQWMSAGAELWASVHLWDHGDVAWHGQRKGSLISKASWDSEVVKEKRFSRWKPTFTKHLKYRVSQGQVLPVKEICLVPFYRWGNPVQETG